jgi:Fe-S cluster biogenesis protein NfuA
MNSLSPSGRHSEQGSHTEPEFIARRLRVFRYHRAPTMSDEAPLARTFAEVIAPLVAIDHGTVSLVRRTGDVVEVRFGGACKGCPGQSYTLKGVLLPALQAADPSVRDVRAVY